MHTMTISNEARIPYKCLCGGEMLPKVGTITRILRGKTIRVHNAPYNECSKCGDITFELHDDISSVTVSAYKRGISDVEYFPTQ